MNGVITKSVPIFDRIFRQQLNRCGGCICKISMIKCWKNVLVPHNISLLCSVTTFLCLSLAVPYVFFVIYFFPFIFPASTKKAYRSCVWLSSFCAILFLNSSPMNMGSDKSWCSKNTFFFQYSFFFSLLPSISFDTSVFVLFLYILFTCNGKINWEKWLDRYCWIKRASMCPYWTKKKCNRTMVVSLIPSAYFRVEGHEIACIRFYSIE